jgi:hypothetical protein
MIITIVAADVGGVVVVGVAVAVIVTGIHFISERARFSPSRCCGNFIRAFSNGFVLCSG